MFSFLMPIPSQSACPRVGMKDGEKKRKEGKKESIRRRMKWKKTKEEEKGWRGRVRRKQEEREQKESMQAALWVLDHLQDMNPHSLMSYGPHALSGSPWPSADHCLQHLHGEVGDEGCFWNLHLELNILVLRSSVEHSAGHCGEGIARNNGRLHRELRHQGLGFLRELKCTLFSGIRENWFEHLRLVGVESFPTWEIISNLRTFGIWVLCPFCILSLILHFNSLHL